MAPTAAMSTTASASPPAIHNSQLISALLPPAALLFVVLCREARHDREILECRDIPSHRVRRDDLAQQPAHDFSATGFRQRVGEADLLRFGEAPDLMRHPFAQL